MHVRVRAAASARACCFVYTPLRVIHWLRVVKRNSHICCLCHSRSGLRPPLAEPVPSIRAQHKIDLLFEYLVLPILKVFTEQMCCVCHHGPGFQSGFRCGLRPPLAEPVPSTTTTLCPKWFVFSFFLNLKLHACTCLSLPWRMSRLGSLDVCFDIHIFFHTLGGGELWQYTEEL